MGKVTKEQECGGLPEISDEVQAFVQILAQGKVTLTDAYRMSHDVEHWSQPIVSCAASRLNASYEVKIWLNAVQDTKLAMACLTKDAHLARLRELSMNAEKSGNYGAAVQAEQLRGKVQGYHVERIEDVTKDLDPIKELEQVAEDYGQEVALQLAKENGIPWIPNNMTSH